MDVLDSPVRQQQATFMFEVSALGYAFDDLLCKRPILRMYALEHHVQGRFLGAIVLEDAIGFV